MQVINTTHSLSSSSRPISPGQQAHAGERLCSKQHTVRSENKAATRTRERLCSIAQLIHIPNVRTVATTKRGRVTQTSEAPLSTHARRGSQHTMLSSSVVGEVEADKEVCRLTLLAAGLDAGQVQGGAATVVAGSNVAAKGHATAQIPALVIEESCEAAGQHSVPGDAVDRVERWLCASRGCATRGSELRKAKTLDIALRAVAHVALMWSSAANDHYDQRRWWRRGGEDACLVLPLSLPSSLSLRREGKGEGGEAFEGSSQPRPVLYH
jgi:hypothetical protein